MKKAKIKAIIFDMDGVMFDTEKLYRKAFIAIAKKWDWENEITKEFMDSNIGKSKKDIRNKYKELLDAKSIARSGKEFDFDEHLKQVYTYMDNYIETKGTIVKEGLVELLGFAKENNLRVAIGTSENYKRVQFYLEYANIPMDTFDAIVCGDMVQHGKPAPDIFIMACEELSVKPEEAVVLEDSLNGIIAAHRAGTKPIMIIDCIPPTDEIMKLLFFKPLNSLLEVAKIIKQL